MKNIFNIIIFVVLAVSCSHMKSGQHVYWAPNEKITAVAEKCHVTVDELKKYNQNARPGMWVFVPNKVGWYQFFEDTTAEDDYSNLGSKDWLWPVPGIKRVTSNFGMRSGRHHDGIDIAGPVGSKIIAVAAGKIKYSDNKISGYGNMIIIQHKDDIFSVYAHNNKNLVSEGDTVRQGQVIAHLGNTGRSTGPHLHFEMRYKNKARNPAKYVQLPAAKRR